MTGVGGLVQAFQTAEELEAEDSWFCSKCKRHVQANKKLDLWAVPEVLVVHLKRFFFTRARRDKLDVQVDFPLEDWDLSDYLPHHQVHNLQMALVNSCTWAKVGPVRLPATSPGLTFAYGPHFEDVLRTSPDIRLAHGPRGLGQDWVHPHLLHSLAPC